jgi:general nucleoside transport system permease protein
MSDTPILVGFLAATIRIATPLLLAATGELVVERAGVINLGLEGAMLSGALASAIGAVHGGPWVGLLAGLAAGLLVAGVFALVTVVGRAQQIIAGTAVTLGAIGVTGVVYRSAFGVTGPGLSVPTFPAIRMPAVSSIPILGPALSDQSILTYLSWIAVPIAGLVLFRTWWGLALRASGESAAAAVASGVPVKRVRAAAILAGGVMGGAAGASLVLGQVGTFAENMTAGRGFIAIAIVVLGRWQPVGVLLASLLFGAAGALQFAFQAGGLTVPYQLVLAMPYGLALLALAGAWGRSRAPAGLGR